MHGLVMPLDPIIFSIGPLALRWYGLMIGIGILVGLRVIAQEADRRGLGRDHIYNLAAWFVVGGIVGGRLYYVVQNDFGFYLTHPFDMIATWEGGMAYYGIFLTCVPIGAIYVWRRHLPFWTLADCMALGLPLGQAFGRVGNVVNGDIVGYETTSPVAIIYTNQHSFAPALNTPFVPANVYELLISLAIFGVLWYARTRIDIPGIVFVLYLELYSISQFFIFFIRNNSVTLLGLKQAQLTALIVVLALIPVASYLRQRWINEQGKPDDESTALPQEMSPQA